MCLPCYIILMSIYFYKKYLGHNTCAYSNKLSTTWTITTHSSFVNDGTPLSTGSITWAIASEETVSTRFFLRLCRFALVADGVGVGCIDGSFLTFQNRMQEGDFSPGLSRTSNLTWYDRGDTLVTVPTRRMWLPPVMTTRSPCSSIGFTANMAILCDSKEYAPFDSKHYLVMHR